MKTRSYYGPGGALVTDRVVEGLTHELLPATAKYYGGNHFIAESMTRQTAEAISRAFDLEMVSDPFIERTEP